MARNYRPPELQEARYYCEHCSHEVPFNASICPHCKKTFDSVKCPICGFSGPPDKFLNGCPQCGHLSSRSVIGRRRGVNVETPRTAHKSPRKHDWVTPLLTLFAIGLLLAIGYFYVTKGS